MIRAPVVIVGGGVSGLATAYYLGRRGVESILLEKSDRLGGLIRTDIREGCRLEAGPDSYLAAKPAVTELARELGDLGDQVISSNDRARRIFIARSGRLVPLPQGMKMMVPGKWMPALSSQLFTPRTKLRFLAEPLSAPRQRAGDVSVARLVSDHFGRELVEYVADPLLAGVYGGSAETLSAESVLPRFVGYEQRYGSLIRAVRRERSLSRNTSLFLSFREGMQSLTDSLAQAIAGSAQVIYAEATGVHRTGALWEVHAGARRISATHLVLACPAHTAGQLLEGAAPELATDLLAIPYSPAILVTLLYRAGQVRHPLNGFGFLVPQAERRTLAAATWISTKFPQRVAPGLVALRGFIVGREAARFLRVSDTELLGLVEADFGRWMAIDCPAQASLIHRWPDSMPQYVVGHKARQQRIADLLQELPGLYLAGNAYDGVGVPDCVWRAQWVAAAIAPN